MFANRYEMLGMELVVVSLTTGSNFQLETKIYDYLKAKLTANDYKYYRIDTKAQMGFPDVLALKGDSYCLIEAKRLKKSKLVSLEDDLEWQFGQIAFAIRAFSLDLNYLIAVGKGSSLAFIGKEKMICQIKGTLT